jgi:dipeptide/tripeptide permease
MDEEDKVEVVEEPEPPQAGLLSSIFGSFNKTFWVVNAFELFERGAYYGTMSVMAVHVVNNLAIDRATWGALYSFLIVLLYFIPLFSAALAEKIGFKLMLLVAYSLMIVGYISLYFVEPGDLTALVVSFLFVGIGAGLFKPIISASIAHVTPEEKRNLAYSIYYWMINLGAVLAPFVIFFAFPDVALYYYVFLFSTGLIVVNILILLTLFRNPIEPQPDLAITSAMMRIVPALRDRSFVILLVIYAGFWFMFAYNHTFLPNYLVDFGRMPIWFTAPLLAIINPGTIVILGPYLGKRVEKYKSLNVMMFGMVIFIIGFGMNGMSSGQFMFVAGIIIFSIGEFIVHPGFISYVSKIAPKDKVSIYLACIFVSTGLGQVLGGVVQGQWYQNLGYEQGRPQVYIALVMVVGMLTLIAFILYNKWQIRETLVKDPKADVDTGIWTKPITIVVVLLFIPITVMFSYSLPIMELVDPPDEPDDLPDWSEYVIETEVLPTETGYSNENAVLDVTLDVLNANVRSITVTLTWTDEPDAGIRYTNEPDEFSLDVSAPNATTVQTPMSPSGRVSVTITYEPPANDPYFNGTGDYDVTIVCGVCGNQVPFINFGGLREIEDPGNAWTLEASYDYYVKATD